MSDKGRLQPARADVDESWIQNGVLPFEAFVVGSLVPVVFQSYARILHPAWTGDDRPVRWATVAAWSGRIPHALAEFERIRIPRPGNDDPQPYARRPEDGALSASALDPLCESLVADTATPDHCFLGVWEGVGWIEPRRSSAPRLVLPERAHVLFEGPLDAVDEIGWRSSDGAFIRESPSVLWPSDRAWFVSSDVDQDSTFVGGSRALVAALIADPRLEAWAVEPTSPITAGSDLLNV